jgi:hypothetical protein
MVTSTDRQASTPPSVLKSLWACPPHSLLLGTPEQPQNSFLEWGTYRGYRFGRGNSPLPTFPSSMRSRLSPAELGWWRPRTVSHRTGSASGKERGEFIRLRARTRPLRSNQVSRLRELVYVNGQKACSKSFRLKVDNTPRRLLSSARRPWGICTWRPFRVGEKSAIRIARSGQKYSHRAFIATPRLISARLPGRVRHARLILRAGNTVVRKLVWTASR